MLPSKQIQRVQFQAHAEDSVSKQNAYQMNRCDQRLRSVKMAHSQNFLSLVYLRVICPILRMRQPLVSARRNFYIELDRKTQKFRRKTAILKNTYGRFVCYAHFFENVQKSIF